MDHVGDIYVKCSLLTIACISVYQTGCFMFKSVNYLLPFSFE